MRYVAPNGSSSNDGITTNSPWSLSYALTQGDASTTLMLLPGTYPSFQISRPGTHIASQIKWAARVVGTSGMFGVWTETNAANVTIEGIEVAGSGLDGIRFNASNSIVRNCWVHDSSGKGISAPLCASTLIERNLIEHNGVPTANAGIGLSGTNCIVRGNVIRYNQDWGCQIYALPPNSSAECDFYDNLLYNNGGGVTVWSPAGQTNYVFNNTIVSYSNNCVIADYGTLLLNNNLMVVGGGHPVIWISDGAIVVSDYNLLNTATQPAGLHDIVTSSPGFVNPGAGLYWLTVSSPARGMANPGVIPPQDFFGKNQSAVNDVGAFQFNSGLATDSRVLDPSSAGGADYWAALSTTTAPALITTQPQNESVAAGQNAVFNVAATGNAPLTYQWKFNGANVGLNSNTYVRANCQLSDSGGQVQVTVSNGSGSAQSSAVTLTVTPGGTPPAITAQPSDQTAVAGQNAVFTVTATGDAPLNYQWTFNGTAVGANSSSYTRSNCQLGDSGGKVQVTVTNASGSVQSSVATLTVNPAATPPSITAQPLDQAVLAGQSATFTVTAAGDAPLSYQWTFNGANVGANSSSYTRSNCQLGDTGGKVQVTVNNASGSVQSSMATLTVNPAATPPSITAQPLDQAVLAGQSATFTVTAAGDAPLSYQWTFNGANVGANSSSYTRTNCQFADDGRQVQVIITNVSGSVLSRSATLAVTAGGALYYVATSGSSGNNGLSTASPFDLATGLRYLTNNNTVILMDGTWSGTSWDIYNSTTVSGPATLKAQNKWKAKLVNGPAWNLDFQGTCHDITIDGLVISNALSDDGISTGSGAHNCVIRNCWVVSNYLNGINFANRGCYSNLVEYNLLEGNNRVGNNQYHGLYCGGSNNIVRCNVARKNGNGYGLQFYTGNTSDWINGDLIYNNLTYGNGAWGITVWSANGNDGSLPGTNFLFCNTMVDGLQVRYGSIMVSNNIILGSYQNAEHPAAVSADYNLGTSAIFSSPHEVVTSFSGIAFVNPANGLFWLGSASTARGRAAPKPAGVVDFFGNAQGPVSDIGGVQYNATSAGDTRILDPSTAPDYWLR